MDRESTKLYNDKYIDFTKEPIFFGQGKNTQRYDVLKYKFFDDRNVKMQGFDWVFDECNLSSDKVDFHTVMQPHEKFIYTRVLQRLIFLDSIQGRGIMATLGLIVTLPEVEGCLTTWQYFESGKHSKTYTHNLRNIYDNPSEIFDESFTIEELQKVVSSISKPYDRAFELIIDFQYRCIRNLEIDNEFMDELKESVLDLLITINILEGIRFYSGFSCIWAMNKGQNILEGTSKNLTLIARDENIHLSITQMLLLKLKQEPSEGFKHIFERNKDKYIELYKTTYQEECEWIDYLFKDGSLIGLNAEISKEYLRHLTNKRLQAIGLPHIFENASKNPIAWVQDYLSPDKVEVLPQEGELVNYISGGVSDNEALNYDELNSLYDNI